MNFNVNDAAQAALGFVISQTSHIESAVNAIKRPEIQYKNLVPVDTSAHPWAKTVTYFSSDQFGAARFLNGNSDDVPLAGTERAKHETDVHMAGIGYGFGLADIEQARMTGINLANDDAMAARRAFEEFVDELALFGSTEKGTEGLLNAASVDDASAVTGGWLTATEDQILEDINVSLRGVANATGYTALADTLLLPYDKLDYLATNRLGDTQMTILQFLRQNNTFTAMTGQQLQMRAVRRLDTAGSGNTNRMVSYNRKPETVKLHMPMPHRFLAPHQPSPLRVEVAGIFRVGGVDWRLPKEARYTDGI